jgi:hypothetical protein
MNKNGLMPIAITLKSIKNLLENASKSQPSSSKTYHHYYDKPNKNQTLKFISKIQVFS